MKDFSQDELYMARCIQLAQYGLGLTPCHKSGLILRDKQHEARLWPESG